MLCGLQLIFMLSQSNDVLMGICRFIGNDNICIAADFFYAYIFGQSNDVLRGISRFKANHDI